MLRGDSIQLKLNRVRIDTNRLSVKPLQKVIQFLAQYWIRELVIQEEDIDLQPISSSLEEITIPYESINRVENLSKIRRVNYCYSSEQEIYKTLNFVASKFKPEHLKKLELTLLYRNFEGFGEFYEHDILRYIEGKQLPKKIVIDIVDHDLSQ